MTKEEFISKFSDKDKIEIAEKYIGMLYDQLMCNDYYQKVAQCDLDTQAIHNAMQGFFGAAPISNCIPLYTMM